MIYKDFQGIKLSNLGFDTMRLPTLADGSIGQALHKYPGDSYYNKALSQPDSLESGETAPLF